MPALRSPAKLLATAVALAAVVLAAAGAKRPPTPRASAPRAPVPRAPAPRAKPPTFSSTDRAAFFEDAFAQLRGPRPDFAAAAAPAPAPATASVAPKSPPSPKAAAWSRWISTDTLETEIKRQARVVAEHAASATAFKSGGYWECRDAFSTLAVMFAISAEHDEGARWSDTARGMATLLARAGANCKVGTDNTFREATARGADLADLVRGNRPNNSPPGDEQTNWGRLAARGPLMVRMDLAWQERLGPLTASDRAFKRGAEEAVQEAQVLAALAETLTREGFDDADDEGYNAFSRQLRDAATAIALAAERQDYSTAREAYGRVGKACSDCHDAYRD